MRTIAGDYINELLGRVKEGNVDAFAEMYGMTYEKQFLYSYYILRNRKYAKKALQMTYERAYGECYSLSKGEVLLPWLYLINFEVCMSLKKKKNIDSVYVKIGKKKYTINSIKRLPIMEAVVLINRYYISMPMFRITSFLEIGRGRVKEYISVGKLHLKKLLQEKKNR